MAKQHKQPNRDELIRKIDFFEALEPWLVKKISRVCIPRYYSKGDYVIRQGDTGLGVFFVVQGRFQVEIEDEGKIQAVAILKEEQVFGELAVLDNQPRSASVVCLEDDTECLLLTRDRCLKLMNKYPQVAIEMAKALSQRLRKTDEMLVDEKADSPSKPASAATGNGSETQEESSSEAEAQDSAADPTEKNGGTKGQIQDFLVGTFNRFYTMKALTRFSAAVIGCPVEVSQTESSRGIFSAAVGGVKIVLLPVQGDHELVVKAYGPGNYRMTWLGPGRGGTVHRNTYRGRVEAGDRLTMRMLAGAEKPTITFKSAIS